MIVPLTLYCKSYRTDLKRVVRLAQSVAKFNTENIPFFVSVPALDLELFQENLRDFKIQVLADELIIQHNQRLNLEKIQSLPGNISQQIVKSEFWRLGISETYLCLDSDAIFIRPFSQADFLMENALPYTVMDESRELLEAALVQGKTRVIDNFTREAESVQQQFKRGGKAFAFGPFPVLWHRSVWESLETEFLKPKDMTLMDAILCAPVESRWYGEALLKYHTIPLVPCQPLFKVYHYAWQMDKDRRANVGLGQLAQLYSGVIYQSAWERDMDWPGETGNWLSQNARRLRRALGRM